MFAGRTYVWRLPHVPGHPVGVLPSHAPSPLPTRLMKDSWRDERRCGRADCGGAPYTGAARRFHSLLPAASKFLFAITRAARAMWAQHIPHATIRATRVPLLNRACTALLTPPPHRASPRRGGDFRDICYPIPPAKNRGPSQRRRRSRTCLRCAPRHGHVVVAASTAERGGLRLVHHHSMSYERR